jgi:hypothetical protein
VGQKLNGAHQLLAYTDDVNLLGDSMDAIKKSRETLTGASRKVGVEINAENISICCYLVTRMWSKSEHKASKQFFKNVSQFEYL